MNHDNAQNLTFDELVERLHNAEEKLDRLRKFAREHRSVFDRDWRATQLIRWVVDDEGQPFP